ncbi:MAG: hypothetical protein J6B85_05050 [Lachnospiraceae bacterium]|nr:hypothetical protein [Lachnospiraceae bacterium]
MRYIKKSIISISALLLIGLTACGNNTDQEASGNTPVVFYSGNTVVSGGDTVSIQGEYFNEAWTKAELSDGTKRKSVKLEGVDSQSFTLQIPEEFEPGVYTLKLPESKEDILLNAPKVQWMQGNEGGTAAPGGWIRLQGECLSITTDDTKCYAVLTADDGTETKLMVSKVYDAYSVALDLTGMAEGTYQVRYWNGYAGCECGSITIAPSPELSWSQAVYNVLDYGISNRGVENATKALQTLLKEVGEKGGGILYFPSGRYLLTEPIHIPEGITLRGDGYTETQIYWKDVWITSGIYDEEMGRVTYTRGPAELPEYMITSEGNFAIEKLDFSAGRLGSLIKAGTTEEPAENIRIEQVRVSANLFTPASLQFHRAWGKAVMKQTWNTTLFDITGENVKIQDCEFYWPGPLFAEEQELRYLVMQNNYFGDTYAISGEMPVGMLEYAILEDMTLLGYGMSIGGSNIYIARIMMSDILYGEREAIDTLMRGGISYIGAVEADDFTITFPEGTDMRKAQAGYQVCILSGTGAGQSVPITAVDGCRVTLEKEFLAAPDETSSVTILPLYENWYICDLKIQNCGMIELDAALSNVVADGIQVVGSAGIRGSAQYSYGSAQVKWYHSYVNNEFTEGNSVYHVDGWYDGHAGGITEGKSLPGYSFLYVEAMDEEPLSIGTVLRANSLKDNCLMYIKSAGDASIRNVVVDTNRSEDCLCGIYVAGVPSKLTITGNIFERVATEVAGDVSGQTGSESEMR